MPLAGEIVPNLGRVPVAVAVLLAALAGSKAGSLSAGELLAHGAVVWLSNIITFGLLFWQLDEGGPRLRAERGRRDPDYVVVRKTNLRVRDRHGSLYGGSPVGRVGSSWRPRRALEPHPR